MKEERSIADLLKEILKELKLIRKHLEGQVIR